MRSRGAIVASTVAASAALVVTASAGWACTIFATSVTASPNAGPALATIDVQGTGVGGGPDAARSVELRWDGAPDQVLATVPLDAAGHFAATVTVPEAAPGVHTITAVSNGSGVGRTIFEVASRPSAGGPETVTPTPDPWVTTNPASAAAPRDSLALTAGSALLAVGLTGLAGGFTVAEVRRRRATAQG